MGSDKVKKEDQTIFQQLGMRTAAEVIESFRKRKVHFIEPLGLALMTNRRDPVTGLPGIPMGSQLEVFGPPGKSKTSIVEHFFKNILSSDPTYQCVLLSFEDLDRGRLANLGKQGLDINRLHIIDYSNENLKCAETGLNMVLELGQNAEKYNIQAIAIDSVGASAVSREVYDKSGDLAGVDTNLAMCARANVYTKFANQWQTLDPNKRPILIYINHYKDKVGQDDASTFQLKANQVGEDLNLPTPGGWGFKYNLNMRLKMDAKKWPPPKSTDPKHEMYNYREQKGLEVFVTVARNRFFPGYKQCQAILDFTDPNDVRFDLEDEIVSLASMLDIDGIQEMGNGRVVFPKIEGKSHYKAKCVDWLRKNPDYKWELIKKIAPQAQKVYSFDKDPAPSPEEKL